METQEFKIKVDLKNDHVEVNGVKYFPHLKAGKGLFGTTSRKTCRDCVFYEMTLKNPSINICPMIPCSRREREDGQNVYYK